MGCEGKRAGGMGMKVDAAAIAVKCGLASTPIPIASDGVDNVPWKWGQASEQID
jgi:hypothetical protein